MCQWSDKRPGYPRRRAEPRLAHHGDLVSLENGTAASVSNYRRILAGYVRCCPDVAWPPGDGRPRNGERSATERPATRRGTAGQERPARNGRPGTAASVMERGS